MKISFNNWGYFKWNVGRLKSTVFHINQQLFLEANKKSIYYYLLNVKIGNKIN